MGSVQGAAGVGGGRSSAECDQEVSSRACSPVHACHQLKNGENRRLPRTQVVHCDGVFCAPAKHYTRDAVHAEGGKEERGKKGHRALTLHYCGAEMEWNWAPQIRQRALAGDITGAEGVHGGRWSVVARTWRPR